MALFVSILDQLDAWIVNDRMTSTAKKAIAASGLVLVTAIWGSSYIFMKWAVAEIDVYYFLFLRFLLAFVLMAAIFPARVFRAASSTIKFSSVLGLLFAAIVITQTEGLRFTNAANSALITSLYMPLIPICSAIFFRMRVSVFNIIGIAIALIGMYLLTVHNLIGFNRGDALTIVCALVSVWYIILLGRTAIHHDIIALVSFQCLLVALLCGTVSVIKGTCTTHISALVLFAILFTAVLVTVIARIIQTAAQRVISPSRAGVILSLEAVFGSAIAWTFGREGVSTLSFLGACLMVCGVFVSEIPLIARMARPRAALNTIDA